MHRLPLAIAFRQVAPVCAKAQPHNHPFTNKRLSPLVRLGSDALPGTREAIRNHCASLNSYGLIPVTRSAPQRRERNLRSLYCARTAYVVVALP